jgi:S1-C subfamily serine protease
VGTASRSGYAIPIDSALAVVRKIERGGGSAEVHVGPTAFLGIQVDPAARGAAGVVVAAVVNGSPAARAGLARGDVITTVAGSRVRSRAALVAVLLRSNPGASVTVVWTDPDRVRRSARVVLAAGPPQ